MSLREETRFTLACDSCHATIEQTTAARPDGRAAAWPIKLTGLGSCEVRLVVPNVPASASGSVTREVVPDLCPTCAAVALRAALAAMGGR